MQDYEEGTCSYCNHRRFLLRQNPATCIHCANAKRCYCGAPAPFRECVRGCKPLKHTFSKKDLIRSC